MSVYIEKLPGIAFLAFPEMLKFLKSELRERFSIYDENKFTCYGDVLYLKDCDFSEFISDRGTAQQKGLGLVERPRSIRAIDKNQCFVSDLLV